MIYMLKSQNAFLLNYSVVPLPWIKPWSATPGQNVPQNAVTNRPCSGCNVIQPGLRAASCAARPSVAAFVWIVTSFQCLN